MLKNQKISKNHLLGRTVIKVRPSEDGVGWHNEEKIMEIPNSGWLVCAGYLSVVTN